MSASDRFPESISAFNFFREFFCHPFLKHPKHTGVNSNSRWKKVDEQYYEVYEGNLKDLTLLWLWGAGHPIFLEWKERERKGRIRNRCCYRIPLHPFNNVDSNTFASFLQTNYAITLSLIAMFVFVFRRYFQTDYYLLSFIHYSLSIIHMIFQTQLLFVFVFSWTLEPE